MTTRLATCPCGRLSISCEGAPVLVSLCHCLECQKRTGSTYGIAAFFERGQVTPAGEASIFVRPSDSGFDVAFRFCPRCGGTVWWEPLRMPERVAVAVGAFADPTFPAPAKSVYHEHRHAWVADPFEPAPRRPGS